MSAFRSLFARSSRTRRRFLNSERLEARAVLHGAVECELSAGVLSVFGTSHDDQIAIVADAETGSVHVHSAGQVIGSFAAQDVHSICVDSSQGNDHVELRSLAVEQMLVDGGAGDDWLSLVDELTATSGTHDSFFVNERRFIAFEQMLDGEAEYSAINDMMMLITTPLSLNHNTVTAASGSHGEHTGSQSNFSASTGTVQPTSVALRASSVSTSHSHKISENATHHGATDSPVQTESRTADSAHSSHDKPAAEASKSIERRYGDNGVYGKWCLTRTTLKAAAPTSSLGNRPQCNCRKPVNLALASLQGDEPSSVASADVARAACKKLVWDSTWELCSTMSMPDAKKSFERNQRLLEKLLSESTQEATSSPKQEVSQTTSGSTSEMKTWSRMLMAAGFALLGLVLTPPIRRRDDDLLGDSSFGELEKLA